MAGRRCLQVRYAGSAGVKKVYVIAGEASGDALGAKIIAAMQRRSIRASDAALASQVVFRGVGGPQMTALGGFRSLFPLRELSVMGLLELLPHAWRLRRRLQDVLRDIRAFEPDVLLTFDSKGFTLRVHRALAADPITSSNILRMHFVAPSVWAFKHRQRDASPASRLGPLLHKLFVILPFERALFHDPARPDWCEYIGHPVVEDWLEMHNAFEVPSSLRSHLPPTMPPLQVETDGLLQRCALHLNQIAMQGAFMQGLMEGTCDRKVRSETRKQLGIPADAFVVCLLAGSRESEVRKTARLMLGAVAALQATIGRPIRVVLPTLASLSDVLQHEINAACQAQQAPLRVDQLQLVVDANFAQRFHLFRAADLAVAVSGTVVMETTLARLPTVVVYRAHWLTEWIAKRLSAVRFVSIPNLLLGQAVIPELLFADCQISKIARELQRLHDSQGQPSMQAREQQLAMAISTLTNWTRHADHPRQGVRPLRGSDIAADSIWRALHRTTTSK